MTIIEIFPILSSFLNNKLDIFKSISLITTKVLRFLPYFITLLSKNYPCYVFFTLTSVQFALVLI